LKSGTTCDRVPQGAQALNAEKLSPGLKRLKEKTVFLRRGRLGITQKKKRQKEMPAGTSEKTQKKEKKSGKIQKKGQNGVPYSKS